MNLDSAGYEHNTSTIDLPIACTPTSYGVGWRKLEFRAVHLGKWFRLMAPQDHQKNP